MSKKKHMMLVHQYSTGEEAWIDLEEVASVVRLKATDNCPKRTRIDFRGGDGERCQAPPSILVKQSSGHIACYAGWKINPKQQSGELK